MRHSIQLLSAALLATGLLAFTGCEPPKETTTEKYNEAIDEVQEGNEEMREQAQEANEEMQEEAQEAAGEIRNELKSNEDRTLGEKVDEGLEEAGEAIKEGTTGPSTSDDTLDSTIQDKPATP